MNEYAVKQDTLNRHSNTTETHYSSSKNTHLIGYAITDKNIRLLGIVSLDNNSLRLQAPAMLEYLFELTKITFNIYEPTPVGGNNFAQAYAAYNYIS